MMLRNEPRSKAIEAMRRISRPGEEDKRPAGTTPIQNLKLNTWLDGDELYGMRRMVGLILCVQPAYRERNQSDKIQRHVLHVRPRYTTYCCLAMAVVASVPPRPMVSIAEDGTITIAPFSRMAS